MKTKLQFFQELVKEIKDKQCKASKIKKLIHDMKLSNIDVNSKRYRGRTLLHYAVKYQNDKIIKVLIKLGVNPEICDDDYNTPLHYAVILDKTSSVIELLNNGANINTTGEFEQTPLHLAITNNSFGIVKILVDMGADQELVDEKNLRPIDYAIDEKNREIIEYLSFRRGGN